MQPQSVKPQSAFGGDVRATVLDDVIMRARLTGCSGTFPEGSMWAMNPLPTATEYPPPCAHPGGPVRAPTAYNRWGNNPTDCSGTWPTTLYIEDTVVIPQNIEPGEYVLGWRWYVCVVVVYSGVHIY